MVERKKEKKRYKDRGRKREVGRGTLKETERKRRQKERGRKREVERERNRKQEMQKETGGRR